MTALMLLAAAVATFENPHVRWEIAADARVTSLYERSSGRELVGEATPFVALVDAKGVLHTATTCSGSSECLDFGFPGGETISLAVTPFDGGWTFETRNANLGDAASVWFVRLKPECAAYFGKFANAISDDTSAVFVRGYAAKTEMYCAGPVAGEGVDNHPFTGVPNGSRILCAGAMREFGFNGHRAGLAVGPRAKILTLMKEMTRVSGAPYSTAGGAWARESESCRGSYLFGTSMDLPSVDDWVSLAERGGFDLFHFHVWWKLYGSYEIDTDCFPNGIADLRVAARKFKDAGFRVGTHTLSSCIEWGSKCLTPVCDTNLISIHTYTLARPFAPGDSEIVVNEPFWKGQATVFAGRQGVVKGNGNTFRIGNELVQYWSADPTSRTFGGVKRGVFACRRGTYPVAVGGTYPAGTAIHYLRSCYSSFYPEPDSPLMDETIRRICDVYNACDMEEIYFDGSEGMGARYAVDRMRERIFRSLRQGKDGIVNEASCRNPYHWWFRSRLWPWDHNWYGAKALQDLHLRTTMRQVVKEDFFAANTGWWAPLLASELQRGHFLDEMEYFMCKNAAHDVSMAIQGTYVTDGPLSLNVQNQMTILGWWERARMAKAFRKGLQDEMKPEGSEYRLRLSDGGEWQVTPFASHVHRAGNPGTRTWTVASEAPCRAELRVEALYGAEAYDAKTARPLLTPKARLEVTTAKGVTAAVTSGKDARHGATIRLAAENSGVAANGAWVLATEMHPYPDLVKTDGAFGCWVKGDGSGATLAFRLRLHRFNWAGICEHYVKLDFTGWRYISFLLRERDAAEFAKFTWDISDDWAACRCVYNGPWWSTDPSVESVAVGLNGVPVGGKVAVEVGEVRQMGVTKPAIPSGAVVVNGVEYKLPFEMSAGDYAELADGSWTLCDELGNPKRRVPAKSGAVLAKGDNAVSFKSDDPAARAEVTVFALGDAKGAFGAVADKDRRWLDYEAAMPVVYAPSKGFDGKFAIVPRRSERARLEIEIWGPVDTPSVTIGKRTWTFPVKLGVNEHVVCRDGSGWKAEKVVPGKTAEDAGVWFKIAPSQRVKLAEGRLPVALPDAEGPLEVSLSAKDESTCEARFEFVKRYVRAAALGD